MKIGVISDTHLRRVSEEFSQLIEKHFKEVDLVLHAGDLVEMEILDVFKGKDWKAVQGNMDSGEVKRNLPTKEVIEIKGFRIGLIHGWGFPWGIENRILSEFEEVDCIVYGHTHQAVNHKKGKVLFFNPGSPTDRHFTLKNSLGILGVDGVLKGKIIKL